MIIRYVENTNVLIFVVRLESINRYVGCEELVYTFETPTPSTDNESLSIEIFGIY